MGPIEKDFYDRYGRAIGLGGTFICTGGSKRCDDCRCNLDKNWRKLDAAYLEKNKMPCRVDDWDDVPKATKRHGLAIEDFEAVLCGILSEIEFSDELDHFLGAVDWDEVGVSRKMVEAWWTAHKKEDERRRAKEAAERIKEERRKAALAKLTAEDRKALGL